MKEGTKEEDLWVGESHVRNRIVNEIKCSLGGLIPLRGVAVPSQKLASLEAPEQRRGLAENLSPSSYRPGAVRNLRPGRPVRSLFIEPLYGPPHPPTIRSREAGKGKGEVCSLRLAS